MSATETSPQMQALRLITDNDNDNGNNSNENSCSASEVVHIAVHPDPASGKDVILWDDIKAAFDNVIQVRSGTFIQSFLKDYDFNILEPLRIAAVPGVTLDVVVRDKAELSLESLQQALPSGDADENTPPNYETSVATSERCPTCGLASVPMGASRNNDNPDSKPKSQGPEAAKGDQSPPTASDNTHSIAQNAKLKTQASRSPEEIAADAAKTVARTMLSATLGDPKALLALGDMYRDGRGVVQNYKASMDRYKKAAILQNADAQYNIGQLYHNGQGVAQSKELAMHWYKLAADQGHIRATYSIGTLYQSLYRNTDSAASWFLKAAREGFAPAQYSIGTLYQRGDGVTQAYSLAMEWFTKASEQGHVEAQYSMGYLYYQGYGVPQDYVQAMTWYLKAAEGGHATAQANAGTLYQLGRGVPQDDALALSWCRKAADQGNANSLLYLGLAHEYGLGVPVDKAEAIKWYKKADKGGATDARYRLVELE